MGGRTTAALIVGLLLLAGCTRAEPSAEPSAEPTSPASVQVPPGTASDGFAGARRDVTDLTCERVEQVWVAGGAVTNPLDRPATYRIYTSFLDPDRQVRGVRQVDVQDVAPGQTRPWQVEEEIAATDLDCVLRVERTAG